MTAAALPLVIQGGMGVAVSGWELARAVASTGQLGVVSGTALDAVLVRRLQRGDPGGHVRRAMEGFPLPDVVARVLADHFRPGGTPDGTSFRAIPMYRQVVGRARQQLTILAAYVEVALAREGHTGPVGINLLAKIQAPTLHTLYGALLAGVDYVLMGAGIPKDIPGALDRLALHEPASIRLDVEGALRGEEYTLDFAPLDHWEAGPPPELRRPRFLPIVSSTVLAGMLARKSSGRVDGFVVEAPTAGGHNAPPRDRTVTNARGEPVYGQRDAVDLEGMRALGLPFWLAGGRGSPEGLRDALESGAAGIQVGTLFAYSRESGLEPGLKRRVLERVRRGESDVFTDPRASPTGFPFKVVALEGTLSEEEVYQERERVCDLGYLRTAYRRADGRVGYRCPAEPVDTWVQKGGDPSQAEGRRCLCNGLMADVGLAQVREEGRVEPALVTSGDDLPLIREFLGPREEYRAAEVVRHLLDGVAAAEVGGAAGHAVPSGSGGPPGDLDGSP